MSSYKNILVAIDIDADYASVIDKALTISESPEKLSLVYIPLTSVYIMPYLYGYGIGSADIDDIERLAKARKRLDEIADEYGIKLENVFMKPGDAKEEIKQIANENNVDLIVIGTHGRSGFKLLLGSTASAVLHGVQQDVLAVRI
jgi:universal stress protein A